MDDPFGSDDPFGIEPSDFQAPAQHAVAALGDDFADFGVEPPQPASHDAHAPAGDAYSVHGFGAVADPFGDGPVADAPAMHSADDLFGMPEHVDAPIKPAAVEGDAAHAHNGSAFPLLPPPAHDEAQDIFLTQIAQLPTHVEDTHVPDAVPQVAAHHEAPSVAAAAPPHDDTTTTTSVADVAVSVVEAAVQSGHTDAFTAVEPPSHTHDQPPPPHDDVPVPEHHHVDDAHVAAIALDTFIAAAPAPVPAIPALPTAGSGMSIPVPTIVSARGNVPPGVETPSMISPIGGSFSSHGMHLDGIHEHAGDDSDAGTSTHASGGTSTHASGGGTSTAPLDDAAAADMLSSASLSSVTLPRPSQPQLVDASIHGLTVSWEAVPSATAYIVDYEIRSQTGSTAPTHPEGAWTGRGGRVVQDGSHLLTAVQVHIPGLQKRSAYVVRVTAVRVRRLVLPDGNAFEQSVESAPSPVSRFMFTLDAAAEVARLTRVNADLTALSLRIPVLEEEAAERERTHAEAVTALSDDLNGTREALAAAVAEIERLQGEVNKRVAEVDEGNARIRQLYATLEARSAELGEARSDGRHLQAQLTGKVEELGRANAEIDRLNGVVASRGADLDRASADAQRLSALVTDRDAAIAAHVAKIAELEGMVAAKERARADAASKAAALAGQMSSVTGDKDIIVTKLTDDLGKVMEELQRVQNQLHLAQDRVAYLEPFAKMVMDIRERQRRWDEEHDSIQTGAAAAGASPFGKMSAMRKLGPRPTITL